MLVSLQLLGSVEFYLKIIDIQPVIHCQSKK